MSLAAKKIVKKKSDNCSVGIVNAAPLIDLHNNFHECMKNTEKGKQMK